MGVKRPKFDHPRGNVSASGGPRDIPRPLARVPPESKVSLWYQKRTVVVRIVKAGPEGTYDGVVEAFEPEAESIGDLAVGDLVRFRRDKIRWVH